MRYEYKFELYKDFFIKDLNNTIYFGTRDIRDIYFKTLNQDRVIKFSKNFNFISDRQSVNVEHDYQECAKVTYGCFYREDEKYYFNVITTNYVNDKVTEINFIIDPFVTFPELNSIFLQSTNTVIERQHLSESNYNKYIREIQHNDDIIYSGNGDYSIHQKLYRFDWDNNFYHVIIQSSVSLVGGLESFGTIDAPKMPSAEGQTFNKITSPVDLYIMSQDDFQKFMGDLKNYSWITQNFIKITQVPLGFTEGILLDSVPGYTGYSIYKPRNLSLSPNRDVSELKYTWDDIARIFGVNLKTERHLLRFPYCYLEMYTWDGQKVTIKLEDIENSNGLVVKEKVCIGYHNQVVIYVDGYSSINENVSGNSPKGDFMNNGIIIDNFDDIPVLINNYNLNMAKNAYQRELTESKLITNRIANVSSGDNVKTRLFDTINVISNFSISNLGERITDEYEYYRTKNAEMRDSKLTTPTLTAQTNSNNFQIKEEIFGVTLKFKKIAPNYFEAVRNYHKQFGFSAPFDLDMVDLYTMSHCNYLRAKLNNFKIWGEDSKISDIFKIRLENGVYFWNLLDENEVGKFKYNQPKWG